MTFLQSVLDEQSPPRPRIPLSDPCGFLITKRISQAESRRTGSCSMAGKWRQKAGVRPGQRQAKAAEEAQTWCHSSVQKKHKYLHVFCFGSLSTS